MASIFTLFPNYESKLGDWITEKREEVAEKKKISIKFISIKEDFLKYLITFTIEGTTIKDKLGFINLIDVDNNQIISSIETNITENSFSKQFSFLKSNLFDTNQNLKAKLYCDGLVAETSIFSLTSNSKEKKTCYCNRDFTVDEMQTIVEGIRDNTYYKANIKENGKLVEKEFPISNLHKKLFNRNNETYSDYEDEIVPEKDRTYEKLTTVLNTSFKKYGIQSCIQKIHFLAQMYAETAYFTATIELKNSKIKDYDPLRGRGFAHITEKKEEKSKGVYYAYDNYDKRLKDSKGKNFNIKENYSLVATNLDLSADTAGWFWSVYKKAEFNKSPGKEKYKDVLGKTLVELASYGDKYIDLISYLLNGGTNAMNERKTYYITFKNILDYENCKNKK